MPVTRLTLAALCALFVLAPAASASPGQKSVMMDDDLLVYRGDQVRDQSMRLMKQLGVDTVRVTVLWRVVAERAKSTRKRRRRFDPRRPGTYPHRNWDRYDRLVRAARTLGLEVYFDLTPPGPRWAHRKAPRGLRSVVKRAWKPNSGEFANFVQAVGRRYSGRYRDENDERQVLPRVAFWALTNETNQAGWLAPQWERGRMYAPMKARELYLRGRAALDRSGHGRDTILFGELAPLGSSKRGPKTPIYPKTFLRSLLCASGRGPRCSLFDKYGPIRATGIAHHPYTKNVSPLQRSSNPNAITMANIDELPQLIDQIAQSTRHIRAGLPVYLTEFGFETNPPDPFSGVPLQQQADWNQLGEFMAWSNPRVASQTQFLLRDVPPVRGVRRNSKARWFTYQSGLYFANGVAKPSANAYYFPFLATPAGPGTANVWGQMRFRPDGLGEEAQVQYQAPGTPDWVNVGAPMATDFKGYFTGQVQYPGPGQLRAVWPLAQVTSLPVNVP